MNNLEESLEIRFEDYVNLRRKHKEKVTVKELKASRQIAHGLFFPKAEHVITVSVSSNPANMAVNPAVRYLSLLYSQYLQDSKGTLNIANKQERLLILKQMKTDFSNNKYTNFESAASFLEEQQNKTLSNSDVAGLKKALKAHFKIK